MAEKEVTQIQIDGRLVGIVGLEEVLTSLAATHADDSDEIVTRELVDRVTATNYIPERAKAAYGKALLRELRKSLGQPFREEAPTGLRIRILGPGCFNCIKLENDVRDVMAELRIAGDLIHVTEMHEIGRYGVMGVPALVINDKVVASGNIPSKGKIKQMLQKQ